MRFFTGAFVGALAVLSLNARAECPEPPPYVRDPLGPRCGQYYSYDSYSLGLGHGYEGLGVMPVPMDEECYRIGLGDGRELAAAFSGGDRAGCDAAYAEGKRQAIAGEPRTITMPSECSNAGYPVGSTLLPITIRLDSELRDLGPTCLRAYSSGREQGYCGEASEPPASGGKLATCYEKGHEDGVLARPPR